MNAHQKQLIHPKYRPDIDGLRAIAVLSVVGYHAFPGWLKGGFIGVDIFFVISGFLISTIIFGNLEKGKFSYAEFYSRRIKRIFPALLLVLFVCLIFGWYVLFFDEFFQLGKHIAAGAGFVSNLALWSEIGYFDRDAETKPLLHLWSLGIEEQFYILWPLLLGFVWRNKINFLKVTIIVACISFLINIYWVDRDPAASFFSPFSRFWELMAGGILAYIVLHKPQFFPGNTAVLSFFSLIGLLLIGFSVFFVTAEDSFPGWWAIAPVTGTFLAIAATPAAFVNRYCLSNRLMVWVGLISYPLYLWHWPILSFIQIIEGETPERAIRMAGVLASVVLAAGTYLFVEKPFKRGYSRLAIFMLSVSMALIMVVGLIIWAGFILPRHHSAPIKEIVTARADYGYPGTLKAVSWKDETLFIKEGAKSKTLFFGDSKIEHHAPRIDRLLDDNKQLNTAVFLTKGACPPIPGVFKDKTQRCAAIREAAIAYMDRPDVEAVVIGAAWNMYLLNYERITERQRRNPTLYYYQDDQGAKFSMRGGAGDALALQALEVFLGRIAQNKRVYLLLDNPWGVAFSPESFLDGSRLKTVVGNILPGHTILLTREQQLLREKLVSLAARSGAIVIDPSISLCAEQRCRATTEDGKLIYKDWGHLRPFFVEQEAAYIDVAIQ